MTREEAIQRLSDLQDGSGQTYEAIRMAIEALQIDTTQGVGRYENAMQKLREMPRYLNNVKAKQIKKISTDAAQGEWIEEGEYAECSMCGAHSGTQFDGVEPIPLKTNYCPNCGAKMKTR